MLLAVSVNEVIGSVLMLVLGGAGYGLYLYMKRKGQDDQAAPASSPASSKQRRKEPGAGAVFDLPATEMADPDGVSFELPDLQASGEPDAEETEVDSEQPDAGTHAAEMSSDVEDDIASVAGQQTDDDSGEIEVVPQPSFTEPLDSAAMPIEVELEAGLVGSVEETLTEETVAETPTTSEEVSSSFQADEVRSEDESAANSSEDGHDDTADSEGVEPEPAGLEGTTEDSFSDAPPPSRKSGLPPRRSAKVEESAPPRAADESSEPANLGVIPPRNRPLPPRRPATRPAPPMATAPPQATPPPAAQPATETSDATEAADALRLALEASQNELAHLSAARNQAIAAIEQQERAMQEVQTRLTHAETERQATTDRCQALEAEKSRLEQAAAQLGEQLQAAQLQVSELARQVPATPVEETIQQIETQHAATVNELRTILGQHEANEASLARERDSLSTRVEELQRRFDANGPEAAAVDPGQLAALQAELQQQAANLSLANETVNQLNQNLSLRDARIHALQQGQAALRQQLEEVEAKPDLSSEVADLESRREQIEKELNATKQALEASSHRNSELETRIQQLQATTQEATRTQEEKLRQLTDELKRSQQQLAEQQLAEVPRQDLETLEAERDRALAELENLGQRLAGQQQENVELGQRRDELEAAQQQLLATKEELSAEIETLRAADASDEVNQLRTQVSNLDKELAQARGELDAHTSNLQTTREKLQANVEELARKDDAVQEADQARLALEEELALVRKELEARPAGPSEEQVIELDKLRTENQEYRKSVAQLHAVANEFEEVRGERKREQETARQRLQEAATANAELTAQVRDAHKQHEQAAQQAAKELAAAHKAVKKLEKEVEKQQQRIEKLSAKPSATRKKAAKSEAPLENGQPPAATESHQGTEPEVDDRLGPIFQRRPSEVDDLKRIDGVGPALEKRLNAAGIFQFAQVKAWTKAIAANIDSDLSLGGRIARDKWVAQAKKLDKK